MFVYALVLMLYSNSKEAVYNNDRAIVKEDVSYEYDDNGRVIEVEYDDVGLSLW